MGRAFECAAGPRIENQEGGTGAGQEPTVKCTTAPCRKRKGRCGAGTDGEMADGAANGTRGEAEHGTWVEDGARNERVVARWGRVHNEGGREWGSSARNDIDSAR